MTIHLIKLSVGPDSLADLAAWQKLLELRPLKKEGVPHCGLVCDKELVALGLL